MMDGCWLSVDRRRGAWRALSLPETSSCRRICKTTERKDVTVYGGNAYSEGLMGCQPRGFEPQVDALVRYSTQRG